MYCHIFVSYFYLFYILRVRGTLGSILTLFLNVGILLGFIAGNFLTFNQQAYVLLIIPCIYMCSVILLPETPFYLVKTDKMTVFIYDFKTFNKI